MPVTLSVAIHVQANPKFVVFISVPTDAIAPNYSKEIKHPIGLPFQTSHANSFKLSKIFFQSSSLMEISANSALTWAALLKTAKHTIMRYLCRM